MEFKKWINDENYKKIQEYCINLSKGRGVNDEDVLSILNEKIIIKNPFIENEEQFLNGWIIKEIKWIILDLQKLKKTKELSTKIDIIEEKDTDYIEFKEDLLKPILNSKYKEFYIDRFVHDKSMKELAKKYNLSESRIDKKIQEIKNILKGKKMIKKEYRGVAQLKNGIIEKVFPDMETIVKEGYERTSVSKCLNNKLKSHAGFEWKFVKELHERHNTK